MIVESVESDIDIASFGERVRSLREEAGLSRAELAKKADISRPYLWQLEDGRSTPSLQYSLRVARALDVTVAQLLGEEPSTEAEQPATTTKHNEPLLEKLFWTILSSRASAMQSALRYEGGLPMNDEYRITISYFDKVLNSGKADSPAAEWALKAVKQEISARVAGFRLGGRALSEAAEIWQDAERILGPEGGVEGQIAVKWNLALALNAQYQYAKAIDRLEEVIALLDSLEELSSLSKQDVAGLHTTLGWTCYYVARFSKAERHFDKAIHHWENVLEEGLDEIKLEGLATANRGLGSCLQREDRFEEAEERFVQALELAEELSKREKGHDLQLLWALFRIGSFYKHIGKWQESHDALGKADKKWDELTKRTSVDNVPRELWLVRTMILNNAADLAIRKGGASQNTQRRLEESLEIGTQVDDKRAVAYSNWFLATLCIENQDWDSAMRYLDAAEEQFSGMAISRYVWSALVSKARVYSELKLHAAAIGLLDQIDLSRMESPSQRGQVLATKGFVLGRAGRWDQAEENFEESLPLLDPLPYESARAWIDCAELYLKQENLERARGCIEHARSINQSLHSEVIDKAIDRTEWNTEPSINP